MPTNVLIVGAQGGDIDVVSVLLKPIEQDAQTRADVVGRRRLGSQLSTHDA